MEKNLNSDTSPNNRIINILMIDDDEDILVLYNRAFALRGHVVTSAKDQKEAFEALSKQVFEVILMDVNMPGTDGISIFKAMRKAGYNTPVIVLSGVIDQDDYAVFHSMGVLQTFEKSANIVPMIKEIESMMGTTF
jgi:DNA-binding NtrC family response regulator